SARGAGARVVLVDDVLRDPAAVGDLLPFAGGPLPDRLVLFTVDGCAHARGRRRGAAFGTGGVSANPASDSYVISERFTQRSGMFMRQVDLICESVKTELDALIGLTAVKIINQDYLNSL